MILNQKVGKSKHLEGQLGSPVSDEKVYVTKNKHFLKLSQDQSSNMIDIFAICFRKQLLKLCLFVFESHFVCL